mgnify:CR=1 FL=1
MSLFKRKVIVGVITPSEVNQALIQDEIIIMQRQRSMSSVECSDHNDVLKAGRNYHNELERISNDRDSLLY